jgi:SOS-response transcriptional repressor LexA
MRRSRGGRDKIPYAEITDRQERVLDFIKMYIRDNGIPPSMAEITEGLQFRSANAVVEHMKRLERQGWIRTEPRKARAIWVLPTPDRHRPKPVVRAPAHMGVDNVR